MWTPIMRPELRKSYMVQSAVTVPQFLSHNQKSMVHTIQKDQGWQLIVLLGTTSNGRRMLAEMSVRIFHVNNENSTNNSTAYVPSLNISTQRKRINTFWSSIYKYRTDRLIVCRYTQTSMKWPFKKIFSKNLLIFMYDLKKIIRVFMNCRLP